uniref:Uncharacterized protein n=1 Tax=Oryza rufipogon TaxID=4529 RepID=A0A0E0P974_ORYRU
MSTPNLLIEPTYRGREEGERGAGSPVVGRWEFRWEMVFPSSAHPGRVVEGGGRERDGRNGGDKSSAPAIREGGGGGLSQGGGRGERGKMESTR